MRAVCVTFALFALTCAPPPQVKLPPSGQFYFPTGLAIAPSSDAADPDGILYVANSNFDRRFDFGSVVAVRLSQVVQPDGGLGLPRLVADAGPTVEIWGIPDGGTVFIQDLAGEMKQVANDGGGLRLFVASRAEGDFLNIIDANGDALSCAGASPNDSNCIDSAPSLSSLNPPGNEGVQQTNSKPRAPQPFAIGISQPGQSACGFDPNGNLIPPASCPAQLYVSHLAAADDPFNSGANLDSYLVELGDPFDAGVSTVQEGEFHSLLVNGTFVGTTGGVAAGAYNVYVSGRNPPSPAPAPTQVGLVRLVSLTTPTNTIFWPGLENFFHALETRSIALHYDCSQPLCVEDKLYLLTRTPDALLIASISGANVPSVAPRVAIERVLPLPGAPDEMEVIRRPGRGDLLVITCSTANTVVIYDDDVGQLVADVSSVGLQPFGIAVDNRGTAARIYVSNFGDGRISVIDIPDLNQPQLVNLVAHLGQPQTCFTVPYGVNCTQATATP